MLSILKILVPVMFSERCAWAARYAARLAREFGSQLFFLNVGQPDDANRLEVFCVEGDRRDTPQINRSRR
jgi:nucleotide-binding universal stress UspA family protein